MSDDFDNLDRAAVNPGKTIRVYIPEMTEGAYLECLHAGQTNRPYWFALAKLQADASSRGANTRTGAAAIRAIDRGRADDQALYPLHVIVGWGGLVTKAGATIPYSVAKCHELLAKLCAPKVAADGSGQVAYPLAHVFDRVRRDASDVGAFTDMDAEPVAKLRARVEWELEVEPFRFLIDAARMADQEVPPFVAALLDEEPAIEPTDVVYLDAFWALSTGRSMGYDRPGPIPWRDIVAYASHEGLDADPELADAFVEIIREMDAGFLAVCGARADAARRAADVK